MGSRLHAQEPPTVNLGGVGGAVSSQELRFYRGGPRDVLADLNCSGGPRALLVADLDEDELLKQMAAEKMA